MASVRGANDSTIVRARSTVADLPSVTTPMAIRGNPSSSLAATGRDSVNVNVLTFAIVGATATVPSLYGPYQGSEALSLHNSVRKRPAQRISLIRPAGTCR